MKYSHILPRCSEGQIPADLPGNPMVGQKLGAEWCALIQVSSRMAYTCRLIKHLNHDKRSLWRRSKVGLIKDTSCCAACFASTPQIALGCLVRPTVASDLMVTPHPGLVLLLCQDLEFSTLVREVLRTITERIGLISRMLRGWSRRDGRPAFTTC